MTLHLFSKFCSTHTQLSFREKPYRLILVIIRLEVTFPDGVTIFIHKQNNMEVEKQFDAGNELLREARRNY